LSNDKNLAVKDALATLRYKSEELLIANGIHDINSYGWIDHDTPDPDFFGHAIYQMEPPFRSDWEALLNLAKAKYFPTTRDETLVRAGQDFVGTMVFARRSFGMALCYTEDAKTDLSLSEEVGSYWQEYATTLNWLNVASDRLREYFVMAQFGLSVRDYNKAYRLKTGDKQPPYSAPFQEAGKNKSGPSKANLGKLAPLAGQLQKHRTDRNMLVHQIASLEAKLSLELLYEQRKLIGVNGIFATIAENTATVFQTAAKLIEFSIKQCKDWYVNLVKASSLVFEAEYFSRKREP
jgi:hypothetical protein